MLEPELLAQVRETHAAVKVGINVLANFDFTPCYELDKKLKANEALLKEFIADPEGVAKREVGLIPPPGAHMHFINEKNEYFPPEGDAIEQLQKGHSGKPWGRIEIRSAIGPGCYAICVGCA